MGKHPPLFVEIDKLTRSIEEVATGNNLKTEVLPLTAVDAKNLKKSDWLFNWKEEVKQETTEVYKLVIANNLNIIQGLISLQDKGDHIFMPLLESIGFNQGTNKKYIGVPGNLIAFACLTSFQKGYEGYVSFESKTTLINHYQKSLGASILFGNFMQIVSKEAFVLIDRYFPNSL